MGTSRISRFWSAAVLIACIGAVHAQPYPTQPVRLVVPWAPGGATDVIARLIAQPLTQQLGQSVVVENKAGAGGNIGTAQFVRAKPDGYTIIMATSSTNAANPHLYKELGFDPARISRRSCSWRRFPTYWWCPPHRPPRPRAS